MKKSIYILLCILLSACAATTPAPSATPKVIDTATAQASSTPTVAVTATVQPSSTPTLPAPTEEIHQPDQTEQADNARATKIAEFSINCSDFSNYDTSFSPNGNWLAISCGYKRDQTLEIVNREGKRWILQFKNHLTKEDTINDGIPMGGLFPAHWSSDSHYLYFTSYIAYDGGGTCFYGYGVHGLFRVEVNTGAVSTVLPATSSFVGYYIAFSPTGRRLAYAGDGNPVILDLQTGAEIKLDVGNQAAGALTWSPDGSELAYATCQSIKEGNNFSVKRSTVKIFSIQKQESRTILEMEKKFLTIESWDANNIITVYSRDEQYLGDDLFFDLNSSQWITPTPTP